MKGLIKITAHELQHSKQLTKISEIFRALIFVEIVEQIIA